MLYEVITMAAPPGKVILKEIQKTKAPVAFDHKVHGERVKACKECHHQDDAGKERKCSTATCHGAKAEGKKADLKEAFHVITSYSIHYTKLYDEVVEDGGEVGNTVRVGLAESDADLHHVGPVLHRILRLPAFIPQLLVIRRGETG